MSKIYVLGAVVIVAIVGLFVFVSGKSGSPVTQDTKSSALGSEVEAVPPIIGPAPSFSLPNYDGNLVRGEDFRGKVLVINSWAAWCPFCKEELRDFADVQQEFADDVVIIAIDRAESLAISKKYSDELGVTNRLIFLLDSSDSFYASIGGFSMPETLFVDREGNIRIHKRGPMDIQEIREKLKRVLNT